MHRAEVGLEAPDREQDRRRHAVLGLDPGEDRRVALLQRAGTAEPWRHHSLRELLECLAKHALTVVVAYHALIEADAGERLVGRCGRDALGDGLLLDLGQPGRKAGRVATGRRLRRVGKTDGKQNKGCRKAGEAREAPESGAHLRLRVV
jgi:hypothetical protein